MVSYTGLLTTFFLGIELKTNTFDLVINNC